jgi:hypothetical protein
MRQISLREDVSSEASRDLGGKSTPQSGIYIPNYHGVNQVLWKAGGDGAIAFYDAMAAESKQKTAVTLGICSRNARGIMSAS